MLSLLALASSERRLLDEVWTWLAQPEHQAHVPIELPDSPSVEALLKIADLVASRLPHSRLAHYRGALLDLQSLRRSLAASKVLDLRAMLSQPALISLDAVARCDAAFSLSALATRLAVLARTSTTWATTAVLSHSHDEGCILYASTRRLVCHFAAHQPDSNETCHITCRTMFEVAAMAGVLASSFIIKLSGVTLSGPWTRAHMAEGCPTLPLFLKALKTLKAAAPLSMLRIYHGSAPAFQAFCTVVARGHLPATTALSLLLCPHARDYESYQQAGSFADALRGGCSSSLAELRQLRVQTPALTHSDHHAFSDVLPETCRFTLFSCECTLRGREGTHPELYRRCLLSAREHFPCSCMRITEGRGVAKAEETPE